MAEAFNAQATLQQWRAEWQEEKRQENDVAVVPTTVSQLIDWFERNFICCVGPARAYFEIPLGPDFSYGGKPDAVFRVVYETYAVKCGDIVDSEKKLVAAMYADFVQLIDTPAHGQILFWRYPEKIKIRTDLSPVYGKPLVTQEAIEDGLAEIPAGSVLGNDCVYYEDCGTVRSWTLVARLCIPATLWMAPNSAFVTRKAEGAVALAI